MRIGTISKSAGFTKAAPGTRGTDYSALRVPSVPGTLCRLLCFLLVLSLAGCSPAWKRKFIRKPKNVAPPQPILVLQPGVEATHPPEVRYQAHFAYWKSWHSDLLDSYGKIRKRDLRYLTGTISELRAMQGLLTGPPAQRLAPILGRLTQILEAWEAASQPWSPSTMDRSYLERIRREIDKNLHYSKVKEWIPRGQPPQGESDQSQLSPKK